MRKAVVIQVLVQLFLTTTVILGAASSAHAVAQHASIMGGWRSMKTNGDPAVTGSGPTVGFVGEYLSMKSGSKSGVAFSGSVIESGFFYSHRDYSLGGTTLAPYGWEWTAFAGPQFGFGSMISIGFGLNCSYVEGSLPGNLNSGYSDTLRFIDRLESGYYVNAKFQLFPLSPYGVTLNARYYNSALSSIVLGSARVENTEWTAGIRLGRLD